MWCQLWVLSVIGTLAAPYLRLRVTDRVLETALP